MDVEVKERSRFDGQKLSMKTRPRPPVWGSPLVWNLARLSQLRGGLSVVVAWKLGKSTEYLKEEPLENTEGEFTCSTFGFRRILTNVATSRWACVVFWMPHFLLAVFVGR